MSTPNPHPARLILENAGMRRIITLDPLPFTLGRGSDRDFILSHPQVSRDHAIIDRDADGYILTDADSTHGTFANGMRVTSTRLRTGDRITLGTSHDVLLFEESEEDNSTRTLLASLSRSGSESDLETLSLFLKAALSLNQKGALSDILSAMLGYAIRLTNAERGFVFLGNNPDNFTLTCGLDAAGNAIFDSSGISNSIVRDASEAQNDFVIADTSGRAALGRESIILHAIRSVAAIPLRSRTSTGLLGLLYLDSRSGPQDFSRIGQDILHAIASQAATLLENFRMIEAERESALLRKELEIAASIQRQMIPQTLPIIPGVSFEARSVPSLTIGGDFYDILPVDDGFVAILGDVSGKGIPAALLASLVIGMFHAQITSGADILHAVQSINKFVFARAPIEKYLTLVAVRYTTSGGAASIQYINGGHVSPVIVRSNGTVETLPESDLPVGLIESAAFNSQSLTLSPGDRLVLMSDGISEGENIQGVQFQQAELARSLTPESTLAGLFAALDRFCAGTPQMDDQTVLTITQTT